MADENKGPAANEDSAEARRNEADKAATTPGPSDKQGETPKPGPAEQQPT